MCRPAEKLYDSNPSLTKALVEGSDPHEAYRVLESQGRLVRLTFDERSLGLSLVLSKLGGGRRMVVVEETFANRGGGIAAAHLGPHDELVAVDDNILVDPDVPAFESLLDRLRRGPRPLRMAFAKARPPPTSLSPLSAPTRRRRAPGPGGARRHLDDSSAKISKPLSPRDRLVPSRLCAIIALLLAKFTACLRRHTQPLFALLGLPNTAAEEEEEEDDDAGDLSPATRSPLSSVSSFRSLNEAQAPSPPPTFNVADAV